MLNVFLAIWFTPLQTVGGFTPVALHSTVVTSPTRPAVQSTTGYSSRFRIDGAVEHPTVYTLDSLRRFAPSTENVVFLTGSGPQSGAFRGALLWDVVRAAVPKNDPKFDNDILRKYVVVTGSDGYQVVLSMGEIMPAFGGEQVLIAYAQNGQPLGHDSGFARIVVPGDKFGGRDVFWVTHIEVRETHSERN